MKLEDVILKLKDNVEDNSINILIDDIFKNNIDGNSFWSIAKDYLNDVIKLLVVNNMDSNLNFEKILSIMDDDSIILELLNNCSKFDKLKEIVNLNKPTKEMLYNYIKNMLNTYIKNNNYMELKKSILTKEDICSDNKKIYDGNFLLCNIFGELKELKIVSIGDNSYDESGKSKVEGFELSKEETEVLKTFINTLNLDNLKDKIMNYCNLEYSTYSNNQIQLEDVSKEINIYSITISLIDNSKTNSKIEYPDISLLGECNCDPEHGICIGFKNNEFLDISSQDWIL